MTEPGSGGDIHKEQEPSSISTGHEDSTISATQSFYTNDEEEKKDGMTVSFPPNSLSMKKPSKAGPSNVREDGGEPAIEDQTLADQPAK